MSKSGPTPLEGRAAAAVQEAEQEQQLVEAADNFTSRDMPRNAPNAPRQNAFWQLHLGLPGYAVYSPLHRLIVHGLGFSLPIAA
jgi:hypothetical protein